MAAKVDIPDIEDEQTRRAFELVLDGLNSLIVIDILSGTLLPDVVLGTTAVKVPHKLDRKPRGYFSTKLNANAVIFGTNLTSRFIELTASATVTADIWVF